MTATAAPSIADAAAHYAAQGIAVVPIARGTKAPPTPGWQDTQPGNPDTVRELWRGPNRKHGLGCNHGPSHTLALDIDDETQAREWLASRGFDLDRLLAAGVESRSPAPNRRKAWYRIPADVATCIRKIPGVLELRGAGGQDVLPPSEHPSGGRYEWVSGELPAEFPEAPRALLDLLANWDEYAAPVDRPLFEYLPDAPANGAALEADRGERYARAALEAEVARVESAPVHSRNDTLNLAALKMGHHVGAGTIDYATAAAELAAAAARGMKDEKGKRLDKKEVAATIRSGLMAGKATPRHPPPRTNGNGVKHAAPSMTEAEYQVAAAAERCANARPAWPDSIPLESAVAPPPFPVASLANWLADMVLALAEETQTPVELAGLLGLALVAGGVQGHFLIHVRGNWYEPPTIWAAVAAPPGVRKSGVLAALKAPIVAAIRELVKLTRPARAKAKAEQRALEQRARVLDKILGKGGDTSDARTELEGIEGRLEELKTPAIPRGPVEEPTSEALARLCDELGRAMIASAEAEVIGVLRGRYTRDGAAANLGIYLSGYTGEPYSQDRVWRPPIDIPRTHISIGLASQPEMIRDLLSGIAQGEARGFGARFVVSVPRHGLGSRRTGADVTPVPAHVATLYADRMRGLWSQPLPDEPTILEMSPAAVAVLNAFEAEIEPQLADDGALEDRRSAAAKVCGLAVRIAGILTLVETNTAQIEAPEVERGVAFARWSLASAAHARVALGTSPEAVGARRVLERLRALQPVEAIARATLWQKTKKGSIRTMADLDAALELLESLGWVRVEKRDRAGRPGFTIHLNPAIWEAM